MESRMMGKVITFTAPEPREGITHVVVVSTDAPRAFLFGSYESASSFARFGMVWLGWHQSDVAIVPLAVVGDAGQ
jgi:hypothetical protein